MRIPGKAFGRILLFLLICTGFQLMATHYRAGEITYRLVSFLTYEVTVTTYTKVSGSSILADRDSIEIFWGDGNATVAQRVNGNDGDGNGIPDGELIIDDFLRNEYRATYSYSGASPFYVISTIDPNRIGGIINIDQGNSVLIPFYIEDTLRIYPEAILPANSSPVLLNPPIDFANVEDTFYHNPNAWDLEGDSLHFSLIPPKRNQTTDVPNYDFPQFVIPGPDNNFTIDPRTGEIVWAVPKAQGIYNVAILIEEYRSGLYLGTILRDMQIIVKDINNDPPQITPIADTCIRAGSTLSIKVEATDPNPGDTVSLSASGGPFEVVNPATFDVLFDTADLYEQGEFEWNTVCEHLRQQFYMVVFRASDNHLEPNIQGGFDPEPLVDLETWLIQVVAPPPDTLRATLDPITLQATIRWDSAYQCADYEQFRYFSVWKREGSNPFVPTDCETGLEGRGYELFADSVLDYSIIDSQLVRGHQYCYRVLAHFSETSQNGTVFNRQVSIPSVEACVELPLDLPVITHASVLLTDSVNGDVYVEWANPRPDSGITGLDTLLNPPPYRYDLYRSVGFPGENSKTLIQTFNANSFAELTDTFFFDTAAALNTLRFPHSYKIAFYSNGDSLGESETAATPWLAVSASDRSATLNVIAEVPWTNTRYVYYRSAPNSTFIDINDTSFIFADTNVSSLVDTGLENDTLYCYRVRTEGSYSILNRGLDDSLDNFSQDSCVRPIDTIAPCAPIELAVSNICDSIPVCIDIGSLRNEMSWTFQDDPCASDIVRYRIHYAAAGQGGYRLIDSTLSRFDTTFTHFLDDSAAGLAACYFVTALDEENNESLSSDTVCIGNCPFYELPNAFTPNGDGANDFFRPLCVRFVDNVNIKIVNRWGNVVFEGEGLPPEINWDGIDINNGKRVSDGVYFYTGSYYEITLEGLVERPLPPNRKGGGFIHVITE